MPMHSTPAKAKSALLLTAFIWGSTFFVMKEAAAVFPPALLMAVRFTVGAAALALLFRGRLGVLRGRRYLAASLITGATQTAAYLLQTLGLHWDTSPGKSAFLTAAYCVLVPFLGWAALRRRPTGWQFAAAGLCILGIGLLSVTEAMTISPGDFATLLSAAAFALNILSVGYMVEQGCEPVPLTIGQLGAAALMCWGVCALTGAAPYAPPTAGAWASLVVLGLTASALCLSLQAYGQQHVDPPQASLLLSLESVFGVACSVVFYGETVTGRMLTGFLLIFTGILAGETQFAFVRRLRPQNSE